MKVLSVVLGVLATVLFIPPQLWAKTFYLKNGEEIEYQSYRQKDGTVSVMINRDTEVEFAVDEVDLEKTAKAAEAEEKKAAAEKKKVKKKKGSKRPALHKGVKPKPGKAVPPKGGETKPAPAASPPSATKPASAVKPAPAPAKAAPAPLKDELTSVYDRFHRATRSGDFDGQMKCVAAKNQAQMKEMLAKVPGTAKGLVKELMQAMTARSYAVTGCTPSSDGMSATLTLRGKIDFMGKEADSDGTVSFVREGSEWKIDKVAWKAKG